MYNLQSSSILKKIPAYLQQLYHKKNNPLKKSPYVFFQNTSRWLLPYQLYSLINTY